MGHARHCGRRAAARPAGDGGGGDAGGIALLHSLKLSAPGADGSVAACGSGGGGGVHTLAIESAAPLFAVGLACSRELLLLEAPGSAAILSRSPPDGGAGWATLATYRWGRRPPAAARA